MTRLYESQGYRVRMRIAASVLVGLIVLGLWYILFQALAAGGHRQTGACPGPDSTLTNRAEWCSA
ncbi:hypothetical protein EDC22_11830 [Tepidamorphus gemmatus]|uniref:Uncharacterized protein n=1 Tax=Tepidamorphus gemmatus TaxID=747076 RepID=A0A4R3LT37_9HYPH|nr:hypothetical protein [Tepidamorphus gemmatus]TCT03690.1 hypothetical protein EDC22_11830 [Tepidamorphus gemmatus]